MVSENNFANEEVKEEYAQEGDYQEMNQPPNRPMPQGYNQQPYSGPGIRNPQGDTAYRQPAGYQGNPARNYPGNYRGYNNPNNQMNYGSYQQNYGGYNYKDDDYDDDYHYDYDDDYAKYCYYPPYHQGNVGRGPRPYGRMGGPGGMISGYGPNPYGGMGPGQPMGFLRNMFYPGFLTNWFRGPRANNFFRGVGMVTVGVLLAPPVARALRPLAVQAVQGVKGVVDEMRGVVADAREEVEDIFAETNWDRMNYEEGQQGGKGPKGES